jgi:hypothetical protein
MSPIVRLAIPHAGQSENNPTGLALVKVTGDMVAEAMGGNTVTWYPFTVKSFQLLQ